MKKIIVLGLMIAGMSLNQSWAMLQKPLTSAPEPAIPSALSKPTSIEWGCPVAEVVPARSAKEAMNKIRTQCLDQVRRAASEKPEVLDVLAASVIWPDVDVVEASGGYSLTGTFFLETLVLQKSRAEE